MKDKKSVSIEFRLTPIEKQQIKDYCAKHEITVSEFIRMACLNKIQQEEK